MIQRLLQTAHHLGTELDRDKTWWLLIFTASYLIITVLNAAVTPLWFDELFTLHLSRLERSSDIWNALQSGLDANPPLNYFLTRASHAVLGDGPVATRMPEILGFLTACLAIFAFLARRLPAAHAAAGMTFPLVTAVYGYAYQARSYAVLLGFCAVSLVFWQAATEGSRRKLHLSLLTLSLVGAISSHYYGILIFLALAAGELIRSVHKNKVDFPVWISLSLAGIPAVAYLGLIRSNASTFLSDVASSQNFWSKPTVIAVIDYYPNALGLAATPIVLCLVVGGIISTSQGGMISHVSASRRNVPLHELAAAATLVAAPALVMLMAKISTGYYMHRYAIPAVLGCAIFFAVVSYEFSHRRVDIGLVFFGLLFGWFMYSQVWTRSIAPESGTVDEEADLWKLAATEPALPIAVSNPLRFLELAYYAPPDISPRLLYLADPSTATKQPDFVPELALIALAKWVPLNVQEYKHFTSSNVSYWIYYSSNPDMEWLIQKLAEEHRSVEFRGRNGDNLLFHAREMGTPDSAPK